MTDWKQDTSLYALCSGPDVPRGTYERLETLCALIEKWQAVSNLTSSSASGAAIANHVADSLGLVRHIGGAGLTGDIGTGAGFPGLVLSLVTGKAIYLYEPNRRKAAFLREAVRVTAASALVRASRIESCSEVFDVLMARAVAPLSHLLALAAPRLSASGRGLFLKGPRARDELSEAAVAWAFDATIHPNGFGERSCIVEIQHLTGGRRM